MRPDPTEILMGACRILSESVEPEVHGTHARQALRAVVQSLTSLGHGWDRVPAFLAWDSAATVELLRDFGSASASPALASRIAEAVTQGEPDRADVVALSQRNEALRAMLAELVRDGWSERDSGAVASKAIARHLDERARRTPIRLIPELARTADNKDTEC